MKTIRLCFLLLLALLLPLRGAVAATMLCPVEGAGQQGMHASATHAHAHAGTDHHDGHGSPDKCNMCSAFCALTPLASDAPRLPEPAALPAVKFPEFPTPAPSFLSDGQERPPRSF
ncbi:DUF2946 family protein [Roseateles saccharophilus]|uniref:DUF2946 family protein n=1 Tax=Roseateles saccharophilus TaxID=304 RepID=UPI0010497E09|nr:DUF2946 family protein [Roseateles saccharophilus]